MSRRLLPLVDADVGCSVAASLGDGCDKDDLDAWKAELKSIKRQNPVVAEFISGWVKLAKGFDSKLHTLICGVCVYKLLASQAEADKMNEELKYE